MKILNPRVSEDIRMGRGLRLNLGSGLRRRDGFYGVDHVALPQLDILADLNEPLTELPDGCVDEIYCRHVLEHVPRLLELMAELHRITRSGGRIEIVVPHFSNPYGYSDPTHVRFFGLYSFYYFCDVQDQPRRKVPEFYLPQRFTVESIRCRLLGYSIIEKVFHRLLQPLINLSPGWLDWYERRWCRLAPANDIRYVLRPKKGEISETRGVSGSQVQDLAA